MNEKLLKSLQRKEIAPNTKFCELAETLASNVNNHSMIKDMFAKYSTSKAGSLFAEAVEIVEEVSSWPKCVYITLCFPTGWREWTSTAVGLEDAQCAMKEAQVKIRKFHNALSSTQFSSRRTKAGAKLRAFYYAGSDLKNSNLHYHALVEMHRDSDFEAFSIIARELWATRYTISKKSKDSFFDIKQTDVNLINIACYLVKNGRETAYLSCENTVQYRDTYKLK
jgi:hypothetical protein